MKENKSENIKNQDVQTQENAKQKMQSQRSKLAIAAILLIMLGAISVMLSKEDESVQVRVGSMKGPTSMGLLYMMADAEAGETENDYEFQMVTAADELLPLMIKGEMDIALVPANVASVLYNKTQGGITVIDINTLGVLYMVSGDASVQSLSYRPTSRE